MLRIRFAACFGLACLASGLGGCAIEGLPEASAHCPACCQKPQTPLASALAAGATNSIYDLKARWETDEGTQLQLSSLRGHPVMISMIYASCEGVCVITRGDFTAIAASLPSSVRAKTLFVLATLDPEHDSAAKLRAYRAANGLDRHWCLLRGSGRDSAQLAKFLGIGYGVDKTGLFRHASELVVLDEAGRIIQQQDGTHADLQASVKALVGSSQH